MNKAVVLAAIAGFAAMAFAQLAVSNTFLWDGATDTEGRVDTGSDSVRTAGYWYEYTDEKDEGNSYFTWPDDVEKDTNSNFFGLLAQAYGRIYGSVTLGDGYMYPYAGIGFNVLSDKQEGADITAWQGICLGYYSNIGFGIELAVEDEENVTGSDNYKATVGKAVCATATDFPWSKFRQAGWGTAVDQEVVLKKAAAIKLRFEGSAGTTGDFRICEIGSLGMCSGCGSGSCGYAIKAAASSSVKAQLSGRVLSFEGISSAKAEVIDLQGQVVKSATVGSSMDLSGLDADIYMVRVAGKSVNFAQKIVLK